VKRKVVIALIVVFCLALLVGVGSIYASGAGLDVFTRQAEAVKSITQAVASKSDITVSVNGSGEIVPVSEVSLGFQQAGELAELNVAPGDEVNAGDVLARLQVNRTQAELADALATAQYNVVVTQQALDDLFANADKATAEALLALEQAQSNLQDVQDNAAQLAQAQQAVADAGQAVQEAETQLAILNGKPSQEAKSVAYSSLLFKEKDLQTLDDQITRMENQVKTAPSQLKDRLRQQLSSLKIRFIEQKADYEKRLAAYNSMEDPADADELALAQAKLVTAKAQLAQAQQDFTSAAAGSAAGDIAVAQARLADAQTEWQRLKDGPDPKEVAMAEATLAAAQAKQALAKADTLYIDLTAPMDGVVTSVEAEVGDRLASGNFITLADMSAPMLQINMDESDYTAVQVGYKVSAVFDAYPGTTISGEVVQVYPSLSSSSADSGNDFFPGVPGGEDAPRIVAIQDLAGSTRALVRLDSWPPTPESIVPLGFTAAVEVISAQANDVLLVPVVALHELDSGGYVVYVVNGSQLEQRPVTVGLKDYTSAQIIDGLQAGEAVSLDDVPAALPTTEGEK
jgi:HlyD family secretion protein